jgi:RHS repeat-associated protein
MPSPHEIVLCQYRYDALDRLIECSPQQAPKHQRFYCKSRLATEIQGAIQHSIIQHGDLLLAQQQREGNEPNAHLLATDQQRSVLHTLNASPQSKPIAYSPYGHRHPENGLLSLLGFNGERPDPVTGHYLLGNGYRAYNPVLMRFNSPDNMTPFGKGGFNSYGYCFSDPINRTDPNGHNPSLISFKFGLNVMNKIFAWASRAKAAASGVSTDFSAIKYTRLGYHGTSDKQLASLANGLDDKFILNNKGGQKLGPGFYATDSFEQAVHYARLKAGSDGGTPTVIKVHIRNLESTPIKSLNEDVISMENMMNPPIIKDKSIYRIQPRLYKKVLLESFDNPEWVLDKNIIGRHTPKEGAYNIIRKDPNRN